jgi:pimeloyl-ACP methyl ester carboxylesterase
MLEMLNPTGLDVLRFAVEVAKVRRQLNRAMKQDPAAAQALAVQLFCAPPASAKRPPNLQRLHDDAKRFFGWTPAQWRQHEPALRALIDSAQTSTVLHEGLKVHAYRWAPEGARGRPAAVRGRMLLCHGWEGYALNFALLVQKAVQAGFEVHAFDHLAHGHSEGTQSGLPIVLATLLTMAAHVEQTAGPIDVLVGHSLGGAACAWAAANRAFDVHSLVLLAPFYDTHHLSNMWAKAHLLSEAIRASLQAGLEQGSGKTFDDFMPPALAQGFDAQPDVQVLVVHDKADKVTSFRHSAALAASAKSVTLLEVCDLGHIALLADEPCMTSVLDAALALG